METQFITDTKGKKLGVILPFKDYKRLLEEAEELQDIKAFDKAMAAKQELIPLREAIKQRKQKN